MSRKRETGKYTGERDGAAWKRGSQYLNYLFYLKLLLFCYYNLLLFIYITITFNKICNNNTV